MYYDAILYRLRDITIELLVENREIFILHLYLAPPQGVTRRKLQMFDTDNTRMIGLPCGEEVVTIYEAFSTQYRSVTDRQNPYINIARPHCCADAR